MNPNNNRKENNNGKWIGAVLFMLLVTPSLIPLAIFVGIIWLVIKFLSKPRNASQASSSRYTTRQKSFDECPQNIFCRHTDKSEHHVRRGREIDPWDRPDIDISKYQRNR